MSFVAYVERQAKKICGAYLGKEQEVKRASLGSKTRLNRIFDLMGVEYEDCPILEEEATKDAGMHALGSGHQSKRAGKAAGKRKAHEPPDVRIGRELAKPMERKSQKVSFHLGDFTRETSSSDRVSWVWSNDCVFLNDSFSGFL